MNDIFLAYNFPDLLTILKDWQELVGSFIGAFLPICFALVAYHWRQKEKRRSRIFYVDKALTAAANACLQAKAEILLFTRSLQEFIEAEKNDGRSAINLIFFPLIDVHALDRVVFEIETGSGYLDSMIIQTYSYSADFALSIEDIRNQLRTTIELNNTLALSDKMKPAEQAGHYAKHLTAYKKSVEQYFLEKNIPTYFRHIISTKVALNHYQDIGIFQWKLKFGIAHKFFLTKESYLNAKKENFEKIRKYFSQEVEKEILRCEKAIENQIPKESFDVEKIFTPVAYNIASHKTIKEKSPSLLRKFLP